MSNIEIVKMNKILVDLLEKIHNKVKNDFIDPVDVKLLKVLLKKLGKN